MKRRKKRNPLTVFQIILMLFLLLLTLTMLVPLLHILARSLSDPAQSPSMSGLEVLPRGFSLVNYQVLFSNKNVLPSILNSIFITVVGTVINILLTTTAAYVLTRPRLTGKRVLMVFFIIMMRYFEAVPQSLYEAARIDGAGHLRVLFSVVTPLAKAGIATLTMFYGVLRWNEYYRSSIYISSIANVPLQVILRKFVVDGDVTTLIGTQNLLDYNELARLDYTALQYATIIVAIVPILLIYPVVLKYYNKDVFAGGVKE